MVSYLHTPILFGHTLGKVEKQFEEFGRLSDTFVKLF